ncbi:MAG: hypothetical protein M3R14_13570 [Acidobacteriota bacterium]|nr:hypothetical protein [Acidobacteriota bacterium]
MERLTIGEASKTTIGGIEAGIAIKDKGVNRVAGLKISGSVMSAKWELDLLQKDFSPQSGLCENSLAIHRSR